MAYHIEYSPDAEDHLRALTARQQAFVLDTVDEQLAHQPHIETKNRKPLRQPAAFGAQWEIRFGPDNRFRVLYDLDEEAHQVQILAVGIKEGNRLIIGGEEMEL